MYNLRYQSSQDEGSKALSPAESESCKDGEHVMYFTPLATFRELCTFSQSYFQFQEVLASSVKSLSDLTDHLLINTREQKWLSFAKWGMIKLFLMVFARSLWNSHTHCYTAAKDFAVHKAALCICGLKGLGHASYQCLYQCCFPPLRVGTIVAATLNICSQLCRPEK